MKPNFAIAALVSASLMASAPARVAADNNLAAGIVGAIIGGAIVNEANKNKRKTTTKRTYTKKSSPGTSSATRSSNREVQTSLNHFAWNVGTPDGVLGRNSRTGISQYQAFMHFPVTGELTELERTILVTSYQKAVLGGPAVAQVVSSHPQGLRGLLLETRDQMLGTQTTMASAGGYGRSIGGLPPEISDAVFEIARNSNVEPQQLIARAGFIQLADMNADGRTDYLIDTSVTGSGFWCNDKSCAVRVFASTPEGYRRNDFQAFNAKPAMFTCLQGSCRMEAPQDQGQTVLAGTVAPMPVPAPAPAATLPPVTATAAPAPAPAAPSFASQLAAAPTPAAPQLPTFAAAPAPMPVSLASHCAKVSLVTSSNGGFVTEARLVDPNQALGEQFCLARGYAMDQGEALLAKIQGFSEAQIAQQCKDFGALLKTHSAALADMPRGAMLQNVRGFAAGTGMSPDQLAGTAKICLSVGYRTDDMQVAIGSALVLAALGQDAYGELLGHHLVTGIGASERADLAMDWYDAAVRATPVFAPGQPERAGLIHKASMMLNGQGAVQPDMPQPATAPSINLQGFASKAASFFNNAQPAGE
ncbi:MAG: peptidoglycan-binding domain-containing protein [Paracoccaceae bacterium]